MKQSFNTLSARLSISEQRNHLLKKNPDQIFGVYFGVHDLMGDKYCNLEPDTAVISMMSDVMTIYPDQLSRIQGLEEAPDITLIDLTHLRKGIFHVIGGNMNRNYSLSGFESSSGYQTASDAGHSMHVTKRAMLLSNGVLEYIEGSTGKRHLITTLRDGNSIDSLQRTTTAGRNAGTDLSEEVEREHYEEGPFLGKNAQGEYMLAIPSGNVNGWNYTRQSALWWLENKYDLSREKPEDVRFIEMFERNFPGIAYESFGDILRDIVKHARFVQYDWERQNIEELSESIKKIVIVDENNPEKELSSIVAYMFFDKQNNTLEYRDMRRITGIPEGFEFLGKRPSKLFLESRNQDPRVPRIENAGKQGVPTIQAVSKAVNEALRGDIYFDLLSNYLE